MHAERHGGVTAGANALDEPRDRQGRVDARLNMMGDTNVEIVRRHYFNFQYEDEEDPLDGLELPVYDPAAAARHASQVDPDMTN